MGTGRNSKRFPVSWAVDYRTLDTDPGREIRGTGETIDISSTGVLFTADHELPLGHSVELSIRWPVLRYQSVPVVLTVVGEVVRTETGAAAVTVRRRSFLTDPPPPPCARSRAATP